MELERQVPEDVVEGVSERRVVALGRGLVRRGRGRGGGRRGRARRAQRRRRAHRGGQSARRAQQRAPGLRLASAAAAARLGARVRPHRHVATRHANNTLLHYRCCCITVQLFFIIRNIYLP